MFQWNQILQNFCFPFFPLQTQWSFSLANCCNISGCQTLGYIKKHELHCCLHIAYGKQGMSMRTAMCFILSALWQGSENVELLGEKLSKDLRIFGSKGIAQGLFWKRLCNFWCLPEKKREVSYDLLQQKLQGNACGAFSNYLGSAC